MRLRALVVGVALACACTGSNPAFDPDGEGDDGGQDAQSTTMRGESDNEASGEDTSRPTSDDDTSTSTSTDESTGIDPTSGSCEVAPPAITGLSVSPVTSELCPSSQVVGPIVARGPNSFSVADCGQCQCFEFPEPDWNVTVAEGLLPESILAGECIAMHFDCDEQVLPKVDNLLVMRVSDDAPMFAVTHGGLPESAGGWAPALLEGEPCPTLDCAGNTHLQLEFADVVLGEGETATARVFIGDASVAMEVHVGNAHYDPSTCEPRIVWLAKPK